MSELSQYGNFVNTIAGFDIIGTPLNGQTLIFNAGTQQFFYGTIATTGKNIYDDDGTIIATRNVNMNNQTLQFNNGFNYEITSNNITIQGTFRLPDLIVPLTQYLTVDILGIVSTTPIPAAITNIYNGDGLLTSNRIVDMGANSLEFNNGTTLTINSPNIVLGKFNGIVPALQYLTVDSLGLVNSSVIPVGANNIYDSNGTQTDPTRTYDMNGGNLKFDNGNFIFDSPKYRDPTSSILPFQNILTTDINGNVGAVYSPFAIGTCTGSVAGLTTVLRSIVFYSMTLLSQLSFNFDIYYHSYDSTGTNLSWNVRLNGTSDQWVTIAPNIGNFVVSGNLVSLQAKVFSAKRRIELKFVKLYHFSTPTVAPTYIVINRNSGFFVVSWNKLGVLGNEVTIPQIINKRCYQNVINTQALSGLFDYFPPYQLSLSYSIHVKNVLMGALANMEIRFNGSLVYTYVFHTTNDTDTTITLPEYCFDMETLYNNNQISSGAMANTYDISITPPGTVGIGFNSLVIFSNKL